MYQYTVAARINVVANSNVGTSSGGDSWSVTSIREQTVPPLSYKLISAITHHLQYFTNRNTISMQLNEIFTPSVLSNCFLLMVLKRISK